MQPLLDAVTYYLPSPADMPPVEGPSQKARRQGNPQARPNEPFCGLVFKIEADQARATCISPRLFRRAEGQQPGLNPGKDKKENVAQLWRIQADRREQVDTATAGDIVGIIGLRDSITGDTLCDTREPILLESIEFPETVISMAIEPERVRPSARSWPTC